MLYLFTPFWFLYLPLKKEPYHYLRFEKESRYYELRLSQDLLEDWTLIISNGRIKSKLGQSRTQAFSTFNEALRQFYATIKLRHERHYSITTYLIEDLIYSFLLLYQRAQLIHKPKKKITETKPIKKRFISKQLKSNLYDKQQICLLF